MMGKSFRQQLSPKDWWGKRPLSGLGVSPHGMKSWKRILHHMERQAWKRQVTRDE